MLTHTVSVTTNQEFKVDLPAILAEYAKELKEDNVDIDDPFEVIQAVWDGEGGMPGKFFLETGWNDIDLDVREIKNGN